MTKLTLARLGALVVATSLTACMMPMATNLSGNNVNLAGQGNASPSPGASTNTTNAGKAVKEVQITPGTMVISKGKATKVTANVIYTDGTRDSNVTLAASDSTIISVNNTNGTITGLLENTTTIEAISMQDNTKKAVATITVKSGEVTEGLATIDPAEATMTVGDTKSFDATIKNSDGSTSGNVNWTSSNTSVIKVTGNGGSATVLAVGEGNAELTAQGNDSTVKARATITVKKKG